MFKISTNIFLSLILTLLHDKHSFIPDLLVIWPNLICLCLMVLWSDFVVSKAVNAIANNKKYVLISIVKIWVLIY